MLTLTGSDTYYVTSFNREEDGQQRAFLISDDNTHVSVPLLALVAASPVVRSAVKGHCDCQEVCISVPEFSHQTLELLADFIFGKDVAGTAVDMTCLADLCCILGIDLDILSTSAIPKRQVLIKSNDDDGFISVPMDNHYCVAENLKAEEDSSEPFISFGLGMEGLSDEESDIKQSGTLASSIELGGMLASEDGNALGDVLASNILTVNSNCQYSGQETMEMDTEYCASETQDELQVNSPAEERTSCVLQEKSMEKYEKQFEAFKKWRIEKNVSGEVNEEDLLSYFGEKAKTYKSSSLCSAFSMLKATLKMRENVDIGRFSKLIGFLKQQSVGYRAKKTRVLSRDEINKFLAKAPDQTYLFMKVALIIGIEGACRAEELCRLTIDDVEDKDSLLVITIRDVTIGKRRVFTVMEGEDDVIDPVALYRKYMALRPRKAVQRRLFLSKDSKISWT